MTIHLREPLFSAIPLFTEQPSYCVDVYWNLLEDFLGKHRNYGLDLEPDFQRAHVWTEDQQVAFVELLLPGLHGTDEVCMGEEAAHPDALFLRHPLRLQHHALLVGGGIRRGDPPNSRRRVIVRHRPQGEVGGGLRHLLRRAVLKALRAIGVEVAEHACPGGPPLHHPGAVSKLLGGR